jgi:hypothetical protein
MRRVTLLVGLGVVAGAIPLIFGEEASLLPALLFWVAVVQGSLALIAIGDLTGARWIRTLRPTLLGLAPLLWASPIAFLLFSRDLGVYPWRDHPTAWLEPTFFVLRNAFLLLATALVAQLFARASDRRKRSAAIWAVLYLSAFAVNQTVIAVDWVMSFEFPWISTLFGAYFFVEALYLGIALSAALAAVLKLSQRVQLPAAPTEASSEDDGAGELERTLGDNATLLFGFALLWAGQFFAQYLVIWYGNLPGEVAYLVSRTAEPPLRSLSWIVLACLFVLPFVSLLSRGAKRTPLVVLGAALLVAAGALLERLVMLLPVMVLSPGITAFELLILGAAVIGMLRGGRREASPTPAH